MHQRDRESVLVELRGCYVMSTRPLESVGDGLHFLCARQSQGEEDVMK